MLDLIKEAIRTKRRISLSYRPGQRTVEPHVLGYSNDGDVLLRAYQTEGASASGEHENWKLFRIDRIESANHSGADFEGPRPEYNPDDSVMKGGIIARL